MPARRFRVGPEKPNSTLNTVTADTAITIIAVARTVPGRMRGNAAQARRQRLEWLHLLWLIAHTAEYATLRDVALSWTPPLDAARLLVGETIDLRWEALEESHRRRDRARLTEFNAFCDRHPEIGAIVRDHDAALPVWTRLKQFMKARI